MRDRKKKERGELNDKSENGYDVHSRDAPVIGALGAGASFFLAPAANCDEVVGHVPDGLRVFAVELVECAGLNHRDGNHVAVGLELPPKGAQGLRGDRAGQQQG